MIGTNGTTGAGGANVWEYDLLQKLLPGDFQPLPKGASMRVAVRRTSRVGKRQGDPLEDLGVVSDQIHRMTRLDLLEQNADLIATVGQALAERPHRVFEAEVTGSANGVIELAYRTEGLDRIDFLVDARPVETLDVVDGKNVHSLAFDGTGQHTVELRGFAQGRLAAARKLST